MQPLPGNLAGGAHALAAYLQQQPTWRGVRCIYIPKIECSGVLAFHVQATKSSTDAPLLLYVLLPVDERSVLAIDQLMTLAVSCSGRLLLAFVNDTWERTSQQPIFYQVGEDQLL